MIAWPYNGRPGKVNVQKSSPNPATWIRAQVTFRKVENFFVVLFRSVAPKSDNMYLAIDDVSKNFLYVVKLVPGKCTGIIISRLLDLFQSSLTGKFHQKNMR